MSSRNPRRIYEEFRYLKENPIRNLPVFIELPNENDIFKWRLSMLAPPDTPYKFGLFFVSIHFELEYPNYFPKIHFINPIYHINVNSKRTMDGPPGEIDCITITHCWTPTYKMEDIIISIYSLFYMTNPDTACDERRNEYINNRALYEEKIRYFTNKYANVRDSNNNKEYNREWDFSYNP